ncbi:MAG: dihydrolipoyl dehydrogenase [Deltaproteobacteria bacterium]|nr:dihydrolipoyl dehydrogenase [Deltaproteobacteria bacterium]
MERLDQKFDLVVLGAGPGGYVGAIRAAQLGMKVALVDRAPRLGGTCLNVGCIPTKALAHASGLYAQAAEGLSDFGVEVGDLRLDLEKMMAHKDDTVRGLTEGVARLMKRHKVTVIRGQGRLVGPGRLLVEPAPQAPSGWIDETSKNVIQVTESRTIEGTYVLVATGSHPVELPALPFDGKRVLSSTEALSLTEVPPRILVVGAGAVGLELASVWNRLGSQVTVVEMLPQIVPFADAMVAKRLAKALGSQGLTILLKTKVESVSWTDSGGRALCVDDKGDEDHVDCDAVLVAVGRRPVTSSLGLEDLGVEMDDRGRIRILPGTFETSAPRVYAVGDIVAGPMLAHKASEEAVAAVESMALAHRGAAPAEVAASIASESGGRGDTVGHVGIDYALIPSVVYTEPEVGQVGLTEEQVRDEGIEYQAGRFYFQANGRAMGMGATEGFVKVLAEKETDRILGVHILGPWASELVAEAVVAMKAGMPARELGRLVHAHPTLSEAVKEAALATHREAIHG